MKKYQVEIALLLAIYILKNKLGMGWPEFIFVVAMGFVYYCIMSMYDLYILGKEQREDQTAEVV